MLKPTRRSRQCDGLKKVNARELNLIKVVAQLHIELHSESILQKEDNGSVKRPYTGGHVELTVREPSWTRNTQQNGRSRVAVGGCHGVRSPCHHHGIVRARGKDGCVKGHTSHTPRAWFDEKGI